MLFFFLGFVKCMYKNCFWGLWRDDFDSFLVYFMKLLLSLKMILK